MTGADLESAATSRATDEAWIHRTTWDILADHARLRPHKEALVSIDTFGKEIRMTYQHLAERSVGVSQGLTKIGVRRGERVGLWMTNLVEWICTYFGALRIGAVLVPVNTFLKSDEVAYVLRRSGARHLIVLDRFRKASFLDLLTEIAPEWPTSKAGQLDCKVLPDLRNVVVFGRDSPFKGENAYDWTQLATTSEDAAALTNELVASVKPEDLALVTFTSGSTPFPKGAMLQQWGVITNGMLHTRRLGITDQDKWFTMMPFFHVGGSIWGLWSVISRGGTLVFTEAKDGEQAARLLDEEKCTVFFARPALPDICATLDEHPRTYDSIRLARHQEAKVEQIQSKLGIKHFWSAYGQAELYGGAAVLSSEEAGLPLIIEEWTKPLDGQEIAVVDPATGESVAPGGTGEIWVRGLTMLGYFDEPYETTQSIDAGGWMHTQDLGQRHENGEYFRYVGRLKAMLKVGGEDVAVEEVEELIRHFPGVADVAVIGIPDERYGEVPRAYIIATKGGTIETAELITWCTKRSARFKVPRSIIVIDELPRTASGKVDRAALIRQDREAAQTRHKQD